ncbi:transcriptional regulator, partial [Aeromonas salmonicida subsp. achromogenes]
YGRGNWPGLRADKLHTEYLIPVCSPLLLTGPKPLRTPDDLIRHTLLHDTSRRDWKAWFRQLDIDAPNVNQGPIFSHSTMVIQAAIHGQGVALGHSVLAQPEIEAGRLICPFEQVLVSKNAFYLVCQEQQSDQGKIVAFRDWMLELVEQEEARRRARLADA